MTTEKKRNPRLDNNERQQIALLTAQGKTPHAIGKLMGRSENTIKKALQKPELALEVKKIEDRLADKFEEVTETILNAITPADIEKASLRDKAVSAGVLLDKSRLIRGQNTVNTQSVFFHIVAEACGSSPAATVGRVVDVTPPRDEET